MSAAAEFASLCRRIRERHAAARQRGSGPQTDYPFCIDDDGRRLDAHWQLRGDLAPLAIGLLLVASLVTLLFSRGPVLWTLLLATAATTLYLLVHRRRLRAAGRRWQQQASAWPAALVMAHQGLLRPGTSMLPGAMVVAFGDAVDPERLQQLGKDVAALLDAGTVPPAQQPLRNWLTQSAQRQRYDRIQVPVALAGDDRTWLVGLRFDRRCMPNGHVDRRLWFVLARADRGESAELLPHQYWCESEGDGATDAAVAVTA